MALNATKALIPTLATLLLVRSLCDLQLHTMCCYIVVHRSKKMSRFYVQLRLDTRLLL